MSYFTEILTEFPDGYRATDLDVTDHSSLDDLVDVMRGAGEVDGEAVAVIEHEDEWFALIRLTGDDDVKVFVSDIEAAANSPFADLLVDYLDSPVDEYEPEEDSYSDTSDADGAEDVDGDGEPDEGEEDEVSMFVPDPDAEFAGDVDIFADRGVPAADLIDQVGKYQSDPARVVAHVGEIVGFADQLEAAR
ncbi:tRNA adenosine deaminase-associated protein [Brevibacterium litoralis]|uniref:tRNA adenosine deaminase-associated protein n=1 Tax=Brevibacterium litoralis TaxID=3138935 RepID=UPI0032EED70C